MHEHGLASKSQSSPRVKASYGSAPARPPQRARTPGPGRRPKRPSGSGAPPSPPRPQLAPHLDLQPGELKEDGEVAAVWSDGGGTRYSFGALALLYVASHFQCASYRGGGGDGVRGGVRRLREGQRPHEVFSGAWRRLRVCQSPIVQASDQSFRAPPWARPGCSWRSRWSSPCSLSR